MRQTNNNHNRKQARAGRTPSFARFFTRQMLLFVGLAVLIVVVDFFLYTFIAFREAEANFNNGTPVTTVRAVNNELAQGEDGTWTLGKEATGRLIHEDAWALLVDESGQVVWSHSVPEDVPRSYSPSDIAMAAHYASIADYPAFFWDGENGLVVVGFPKDEFWTMSLTYPTSTMRNAPLYVLLIFAVDVAILFLLYAVSKRRTQAALGPIADALDALSEGRATDVHLKGELRDVGRQITDVSALIQQKDEARALWIRGVSHDIRTPLSMILGYADALASDESASPDSRETASRIRTQGLVIKNLVTDLNTASQLDYDMQPLNLERVPLPRLLRSIVADHVNSGLDELHPLELEVADSAAGAVVLGDERLLSRAVENAIANARLHNEGGCHVRVSLAVEGTRALVTVTDDGVGATADELAALEARLARARTARSAAGSYGEEHGLGLVLVDRIARAHDGALALASAPGAGFSVQLHLPLA